MYRGEGDRRRGFLGGVNWRLDGPGSGWVVGGLGGSDFIDGPGAGWVVGSFVGSCLGAGSCLGFGRYGGGAGFENSGAGCRFVRGGAGFEFRGADFEFVGGSAGFEIRWAGCGARKSSAGAA